MPIPRNGPCDYCWTLNTVHKILFSDDRCLIQHVFWGWSCIPVGFVPQKCSLLIADVLCLFHPSLDYYFTIRNFRLKLIYIARERSANYGMVYTIENCTGFCKGFGISSWGLWVCSPFFCLYYFSNLKLSVDLLA